MADEPKNRPDDIQGILSDLDDILSDLGSAAGPAPAKPPKPTAPSGAEVPPPPAVEKRPTAPSGAEVPPPPAEPPKPPEPGLKIELSPRQGMPPAPSAKKPEPPKPRASDAKPPLEIPSVPTPAAPAPKPVEPPKPPEPAKPTAPSGAEVPPPPAVEKRPTAPTKPPEPAKPAAPPPEDIPANTPKDQIRRVAYIHTASCVEAKDSFAAFLSQAARTISKKPLFLREVLSLEVANASDPNAVLEKARQVKAVAVLAVTEGWSQAKSDELSEACSRAGVLFRGVPPGDVQKKATAVDVIVDMMLLPGES